MNKIFIENDHCFMVETDQDNKNGILIKGSLDSLMKSANKGYIYISTFERFNNSKINFDIYHNCLYSLTGYYFFESYSNTIEKVPCNETDPINDPNVIKLVKQIGRLAFRPGWKLAVNRQPFSLHPYYDMPKDSAYTIHSEILYADSTNLKILLYNDRTKELEHWNYYGEVVWRSELKKSYKNPRWELSHKYKFSEPISNNFAAVVLKNKTYIISHEGNVYLANEKLTEVGKLPADLESGFVVINKEKGELSYISREHFYDENQTMRMFLKDAVRIQLE